MATASENLITLQNAKLAIKEAIESKGQDLTNVPFTEYAAAIAAIHVGTGRRVTTGTATFETTTTQQTVTHNLGVVPTCVILYPKDLSVIPENNSEEAKGTAWRFIYVNYDKGSIDAGFTYQGNTNTGQLSWQPNVSVQYMPSATSTSFTTSASSQNYKFPAGIEFEWIAIE
jgi:hypothetical protein